MFTAVKAVARRRRKSSPCLGGRGMSLKQAEEQERAVGVDLRKDVIGAFAFRLHEDGELREAVAAVAGGLAQHPEVNGGHPMVGVAEDGEARLVIVERSQARRAAIDGAGGEQEFTCCEGFRQVAVDVLRQSRVTPPGVERKRWARRPVRWVKLGAARSFSTV
jgi:hypothetical protein